MLLAFNDCEKHQHVAIVQKSEYYFYSLQECLEDFYKNSDLPECDLYAMKIYALYV
jgi:hypothetical protein